MKERIMITLNEADIKLAIFIAKKRHQLAREDGIKNLADHGGADVMAVEINGMGGELAFCKHVNCYPDTDTLIKKPGDAYAPGYGLVDVKTVDLEHKNLAVPERKSEFSSNTYALMLGTMPTYWFVGWCKAESVIRPELLKVPTDGGGPFYLLKKELLLPPIPKRPEQQRDEEWWADYDKVVEMNLRKN